MSFIEILRILACRCAQDGRPVTWLTRSGRFLGRLEGPVSGNVLLRRAQHQALDSPSKTLEVARNLVAGKLKNQRNVILRSAREADNPKDRELLSHTARLLADTLLKLPGVTDLDTLRGMEGDAARHYFAGFSSMLRTGQKTFAITGRTRRPPLDPTNALLSFLYALLLSDCVAGAQGVGLDPQMGFLHSLRPGGLPWDWTS
ncbi:MAG: CRISPR-associated endonuclease Cas1 [Syntrophales bacterium]|nr:CRISPR-associated endonuclease Cas1 [Syntrophales bacterium]